MVIVHDIVGVHQFINYTFAIEKILNSEYKLTNHTYKKYLCLFGNVREMMFGRSAMSLYFSSEMTGFTGFSGSLIM